MKLQTFDQQGNLVEETELEIIQPPDVTGFITQMMLNPGYQGLVMASPPATIARLETLMIRLENRPIITRADLEIIKFIWDYLTANFLENSDSITSWVELANTYHMPFTFAEDGELQINTDFQ